MAIEIKWLTQSIIQQKVDDFLQNYWLAKSMPIDIELIIEKNLKLEIIPEFNLSQIAFLSGNRKSIYVDNKHYQDIRLFKKYRFSLSHEIGHFLLHDYVYKNISFNSIDEYISFIQEMDDKTYSYFEWQANQFAGRLLVPRQELAGKVFDIIKNDIEFYNNLRIIPEIAKIDLYLKLSDYFEVSQDVIGRRINDEQIMSIL